MYVSSTRPTLYSGPYGYIGSRYTNGCQPAATRYTSDLGCAIRKESVISWRGPVDKNVAHDFTRYLFKENSEDLSLYTCTTGGYTDGGDRWLIGLPSHPNVQPALPWGYGLIDNDLINSCHDYLVAQLWAKANQPKFDLAVFLAELGETVAYIWANLKNILELLYKTRAKIKSFRHAGNRKSIEGAWLEYRYAILPLMLDIESIISLFEVEQPKTKMNVGFKDGPIKDSSNHSFSFKNGITISYVFENKTIVNIRGGAGFRYGVKVDPSPYGSSLTDVIRAGWEVVPLSFIVDWFIGVGDWLTGMRSVSYDLYAGYSTVVYEKETSLRLKSTTNCSIIHCGALTSYTYAMVRRQLGQPPALPVLNPLRLKWFRQLDAAALTISFLVSLIRRK